MASVAILPTSYQLFLGTIGLAIHLFIAVHVWRSAEENGMSPLGWALLYFFTAPLGYVIFMIARGSSLLGGSSVKPSYNPARARAVDQRSMEGAVGGARTLQRPSKGFYDGHLNELISSDDWDAAREHADEMRKLSEEDGNRALAGDYRVAMMWVEAKRNPFKG